ncbi:hypothetical protein J3E72DRAFT_278253 [Bipolaris maydis]|uniref:uncharacterized protein n=1 Tax=Cochliobolus heterostrophus TaxID=5016 RepID=UPI0024D1C0C5|nr:hypothetical protein J3E73DRAFT_301162 [Bipolaris maydis]KAJ5059160.1 hypothetical protein J3E74DRAFT_355898 [Bipolaris maydis]KAJ6202739.1 hypothetical protein J3E72DRAFT_278253 [Bipolaris maydis]KAJ6209149.1 hypothetical protein PSV09DRAFT_2315625 [Bipolaris maydis]KAJ6271028.1 hypothetical protein PSV08DRAFT_300920 [Bipolaris maydis]
MGIVPSTLRAGTMLHQNFYVVLIMYHFANLELLDYILGTWHVSFKTPWNITTVVFPFFSFSLLFPAATGCLALRIASGVIVIIYHVRHTDTHYMGVFLLEFEKMGGKRRHLTIIWICIE